MEWTPVADEPVVEQAPVETVESFFGDTAAPATTGAEDDDFDIVMPTEEDLAVSAAQPKLNPNAEDHSAIDDKVTNPKIQKRIAALIAHNKLKDADIERHKRIADAAIRAGQALADRIKSVAGDSHTTTRAAVNLATEKNKTDLESAQQAIRQARAEGDTEKELAALARFNRASQDTAIVEQLSVGDAPPEYSEVAQFANLQEQIRQLPPQTPPPPEAFLDWLQANPRYLDPSQKAWAMRANALSESLAMGEGIPPDHPEHYRRLSVMLGATDQALGDPNQQQRPNQRPAATAPTPVRQSVTTVAPVGNRGSAPRRTITPTAEDIHFSREWDIDVKSLYKKRAELKRV